MRAACYTAWPTALQLSLKVRMDTYSNLSVAGYQLIYSNSVAIPQAVTDFYECDKRIILGGFGERF